MRLDRRSKSYSESSFGVAQIFTELISHEYSTQAGKLMGISKRKILYDADAGLLTGTRSSGGNSRKGDWKFTRADLLSYKARLEALKVEKQWLTPTDCALIWKVSVNTARNWIDKGKVYSTKTKGGHRLVAKSLAQAL